MEFMIQKLDQYFQIIENKAKVNIINLIKIQNEIFEMFQIVQQQKDLKRFENCKNLNEIMTNQV